MKNFVITNQMLNGTVTLSTQSSLIQEESLDKAFEKLKAYSEKKGIQLENVNTFKDTISGSVVQTESPFGVFFTVKEIKNFDDESED